MAKTPSMKPGHVRMRTAVREWKPWEKSTGPRTPEGKARSRRNGLHSAKPIIHRWKPWKKSTGPRTEEGKARTRGNGLRSALRVKEPGAVHSFPIALALAWRWLAAYETKRQSVGATPADAHALRPWLSRAVELADEDRGPQRTLADLDAYLVQHPDCGNTSDLRSWFERQLPYDERLRRRPRGVTTQSMIRDIKEVAAPIEAAEAR